MNYCAYCGSSLQDGARFCAKCGKPTPTEPGQVASVDGRFSSGRAWLLAALAALVLVVAAAVIVANRSDDVGAEAATTAAPAERAQPTSTNLDETSVAPDPVTVNAFGSLPTLETDEPDMAIGREMPILMGPGLEGGRVELGRDEIPRLIVVMAHWCSHCQVGLPRLVDLADDAGNVDGVEIVVIASATSEGQPNYPPEDWIRREAWLGAALLDDEANTIGNATGLTAFPYWIAVDDEGVVVARHVGSIDDQEITALVEVALGRSEDVGAGLGVQGAWVDSTGHLIVDIGDATLTRPLSFSNGPGEGWLLGGRDLDSDGDLELLVAEPVGAGNLYLQIWAVEDHLVHVDSIPFGGRVFYDSGSVCSDDGSGQVRTWGVTLDSEDDWLFSESILRLEGNEFVEMSSRQFTVPASEDRVSDLESDAHLTFRVSDCEPTAVWDSPVPESAGFESPDAVRSAVLEAVIADDESKLRQLIPAGAWEPAGTSLLGSFGVPSAGINDCEAGGATTHCSIWPDDGFFMVDLQLSRLGNGRWVIDWAFFETTD